VRIVLVEALLVALAGAVLAFAANALSPKGLRLTNNYFGTNAPPTSAPGSLAALLQAKGLQLATSNQVQELFHDPRYEQNLILFIDARDSDHYQAGHIPGAY